MTQDKYAYGDWEVDGVLCPLESAGMRDRMSDVQERLTTSYDALARDESFNAGAGHIDAQTTKEILEAVRDEHVSKAESSSHADSWKRSAKLCEELIDELFEE